MKKFLIGLGIAVAAVAAWLIATFLRDRDMRRLAELKLSARKEIAQVATLKAQRKALDPKLPESEARVAVLDAAIEKARAGAVVAAARGPRTPEEVEDGFKKMGF